MTKFFKEVTDKLSTTDYSHSFICRYNSTGTKWFINRVILPNTHINEICISFNDQQEKPVELVDFEQESTDKVYQFQSTELIQQEQISSQILDMPLNENEEVKGFSIETAESIPNTSKIDLLIHVFLKNSQKILLFTKHQGTRLAKKVYSLSQKEFKEIEKDKLYMFNTEVTCSLIKDQYYIFNIKKFCGLFKYWVKLEEMRDEVIKEIEGSNIISNFEEYSDTYKKFYNMKSIIKIKEVKTDLKEYVRGNKDLLDDVCKNNSLSLSFDKTNEVFTITSNEGVTVLNRILSGRSGYHLSGSFITFPSFQKYERKQKKAVKN